jgi:hypothetical protein
MDLIGMGSYFIPWLGESFDMLWAPISSGVLYLMYKGTEGKVASVINLIEEAAPGTDLIPTFTLTWVYTYLIKKGKKK